VIEPAEELSQRIGEQMAAKYAAFRTAPKTMPERTRAHYAKASGATIELAPTGRILSWDNSHLGLS
jgi:hypothetical protein